MFRWLTRNDGARMARAKKRLSSPRGSVFSELALIVPIVVLVLYLIGLKSFQWS